MSEPIKRTKPLPDPSEDRPKKGRGRSKNLKDRTAGREQRGLSLSQPVDALLGGDGKYRCPACSFVSDAPQGLARHLTNKHPNMRPILPAGLMDRLREMRTVPEVLRETARWVDGATANDGSLSEEAVQVLRREDAKIQLILRLVALMKVDRVFETDGMMTELRKIFDERIQSSEVRASITPHSVASLMKDVQSIQTKELGFMKEISQLGQMNLNGIIEQLTAAFGAVQVNAGAIGVLQRMQVRLPKEPSQREALRQAFEAIVSMANEASEGGDEDDVIDVAPEPEPDEIMES